MKFRVLFFAVIVAVGVFFSCDFNSKNQKETILTGKVDVLVDQTVFPFIEDEVMVFESQYEAKINLIQKPEKEIIKLLSEGKYDLAITTRALKPSEEVFFTKRKIKAKITDLAFDGLAFVSHKNSVRKLTETDIVNFMKNQKSAISSLVFDNANSSTVSYLLALAKTHEIPTKNVFSLSSNNEVLKYVSKNPGAIGVVGVNWLTQPMPAEQKTISELSVLEVQEKNGTFVTPTQDYIGSGSYPYFRKIKLLNYQGGTGLGMGFASFIAGEIGQRIILKAGLIPVRMPSRNIVIRKEVENKSENN